MRRRASMQAPLQARCREARFRSTRSRRYGRFSGASPAKHFLLRDGTEFLGQSLHSVFSGGAPFVARHVGNERPTALTVVHFGFVPLLAHSLLWGYARMNEEPWGKGIGRTNRPCRCHGSNADSIRRSSLQKARNCRGLNAPLRARSSGLRHGSKRGQGDDDFVLAVQRLSRSRGRGQSWAYGRC